MSAIASFFTCFLLGAQLLHVPTAGRLLDDTAESDAEALRYRLQNEKAKRLLLTNDLDVLTTRFEQLERRVDKITTGEVKLTASEGCSVPNVSFHASLTGHDLTLHVGQVLIFNHVLTNNGDAYSPNTGIFRVPTPGTYILALSILVPTKKNAHLSLMKNEGLIGRLYAGSNVNVWSNPGSLTVVVNLEGGDEVRVTAHIDSYIHGRNYSSFSGSILKT